MHCHMNPFKEYMNMPDKGNYSARASRFCLELARSGFLRKTDIPRLKNAINDGKTGEKVQFLFVVIFVYSSRFPKTAVIIWDCEAV